MFIAPPSWTCSRSSEMGRWISELADPFWAAWCGGGRISELKGVFSLFASEMSSETATLKALSWISELTSEDLSLKSALSLYSEPARRDALSLTASPLVVSNLLSNSCSGDAVDWPVAFAVVL